MRQLYPSNQSRLFISILGICFFATLLANETEDVAVLTKNAEALLDKKSPAALIEACTKLIEKAPDQTKGYLWRSWGNMDLKKYQDALRDVTKFIELNPEDDFAYSSRARVFIELKDYERGLADLEHAIRLDPSYSGYFVSRGKIYDSLNERARAKADFATAIGLNPKNADAHEQLGMCEVIDGQYEAAKQHLSIAIGLDANRSASFCFRAMAFFAEKDFVLAKQDAEEGIRLNPSYSYAHSFMGLILIARQEPEAALQAVEFGLTHSEPIAEHYNAKAVAHLMLKDYNAAIQDTEAALAIEPHDKTALKNLASLKKGENKTQLSTGETQIETRYSSLMLPADWKEDESQREWLPEKRFYHSADGSAAFCHVVVEKEWKNMNEVFESTRIQLAEKFRYVKISAIGSSDPSSKRGMRMKGSMDGRRLALVELHLEPAASRYAVLFMVIEDQGKPHSEDDARKVLGSFHLKPDEAPEPATQPTNIASLFASYLSVF